MVVAPDPEVQVGPVLELLGSEHELGVGHVLVIFAFLSLSHALVEEEHYFWVSCKYAEVYHQLLFAHLDALVQLYVVLLLSTFANELVKLKWQRCYIVMILAQHLHTQGVYRKCLPDHS